MLVFFLLNFAGGGAKNFAQAVVIRLTRNFANQFPVRVILSLCQHDVFHRIQFGLILR